MKIGTMSVCSLYLFIFAITIRKGGDIMFIVKRDELGKYPVGTIYATYEPYRIGELLMLTGPNLKFSNGRIGWNGALPLLPSFSDNVNNVLYSNWCTTDDSSANYSADQLFVVFTKQEIERMILILQSAINEDDIDKLNEDEFIHGEESVTYEELEEKGLLWW